jgi:hypothetical protein
MKHFKRGKVELGYSVKTGILLPSENDDMDVFSISKDGDSFVFMEECDGWFSTTKTKEEAIELLEEAIEWIKHENL